MCTRHDFVGLQLANIDAPVVQRLKRRPVTDGDDRGPRQSLPHEGVDHALGGLVE